MPTYQYVCKACAHELEDFQSITEPHLTLCPKCNTHGLVRTIGTGAGLIFKGTGFYLTDYKNTSSGGETKAPQGEVKKDEKKKDEKTGSPPATPPAKDSTPPSK